MDAAQRELNDQIDQATQRLLDDARTIAEADLRAPSLLPGWTRAHVLAHVARGADAMRNLLTGARSGQDRPAYASAQAREADIERGAVIRAEHLIADLAGSAMALRAIVKQLPDEAWPVLVRVPGSAPFPAAGVLTWRLVEVELHHCDLGIGYSPADWPAAFATMERSFRGWSQRLSPVPCPETREGPSASSGPSPATTCTMPGAGRRWPGGRYQDWLRASWATAGLCADTACLPVSDRAVTGSRGSRRPAASSAARFATGSIPCWRPAARSSPGPRHRRRCSGGPER